jgi:hypothetical protein
MFFYFFVTLKLLKVMRNIISKFCFIIVFILFTISISCNYAGKESGQQSRQIDKNALTKIEFESKEFDFGTISSGENVSHRFKFKNVGSSNLYITKVTADCGCTVIDYEKEAIIPGQESYIETVYNSAGYRGLQIKNIKVYSNTKPAENKLVIAVTIDASEM